MISKIVIPSYGYVLHANTTRYDWPAAFQRMSPVARSFPSPHPTSMEDGRPNRPWSGKTAEHEQKLNECTCEVLSNADYEGLKGNFIRHRWSTPFNLAEIALSGLNAKIKHNANALSNAVFHLQGLWLLDFLFKPS